MVVICFFESYLRIILVYFMKLILQICKHALVEDISTVFGRKDKVVFTMVYGMGLLSVFSIHTLPLYNYTMAEDAGYYPPSSLRSGYLGGKMKTMATDNDLLLERHRELEKLLGIKMYFCHQYHSWEKGTIENTNGVIRRDIPKGSDISRYSKRYIQKLEAKLNRRSMECLEDRTPQEVLDRHRGRVARNITRNKKHRLRGVS